MKFIWCVLGFHEWRYHGKISKWNRECWKCKKKQKASYNMATGETIWEDLK